MIKYKIIWLYFNYKNILLFQGGNMVIVAFLIILLVFAAITLYISRGMYRGFSQFFPKIRRWQVIVFVSAVTSFLVISFLRSWLPFSKDVSYVLGFIGYYCMGIFVYLLLYTIFSDLIFLIPRLKKLKFTKHRFFNGFVSLGVVAMTVVTCVWGSINTMQYDVVSYDIKIEEKKDISDINMVLISDMHIGSIGSEGRLDNIVEKINSLKPDVICIAGDIFDTNFNAIRNPNAAIKTLKKLKSTYGVYACLGNHDGGDTLNKMISFLEKSNINLLKEDYAVIDDRLIIAGRLDGSPIGGFDAQKRKKFSDIKIENNNLPVIVLDHNPANIDEYINTNADLILCGHTHKGQLFPANFITNVIYDVDYGYYRKNANSPQVIVTSGVGYWGMPMRVGTDCEIVNISFK